MGISSIMMSAVSPIYTDGPYDVAVARMEIMKKYNFMFVDFLFICATITAAERRFIKRRGTSSPTRISPGGNDCPPTDQ